MAVGNKINYYRKKYKITQEQLAKKTNTTKQYISKLEREESNISIELALTIVNSFRLITSEKSFGMQTVLLNVEDLFFLK